MQKKPITAKKYKIDTKPTEVRPAGIYELVRGLSHGRERGMRFYLGSSKNLSQLGDALYVDLRDRSVAFGCKSILTLRMVLRGEAQIFSDSSGNFPSRIKPLRSGIFRYLRS